jgi:hypothetical protein
VPVEPDSAALHYFLTMKVAKLDYRFVVSLYETGPRVGTRRYSPWHGTTAAREELLENKN